MKKSDRRTKYTMDIFVKMKDGKEVRAHCPINDKVLLASDECWVCSNNLRTKYDSSKLPFTVECKKNPNNKSNKK